MDVKSFITLGPGVNVIKLFVRNLLFFVNKLVFEPGKLGQPSSMFVGKARSLS
jgi:hypothetical protein